MKTIPLREGDRVAVAETPLVGVVNAVYAGGTHFRVRFPLGSPYLDDWAVFRAHEVAPAPPKPKEAPPEKFKENYPTDKTL